MWNFSPNKNFDLIKTLFFSLENATKFVVHRLRLFLPRSSVRSVQCRNTSGRLCARRRSALRLGRHSHVPRTGLHALHPKLHLAEMARRFVRREGR